MCNIGHLVVCDDVFNSPEGQLIIKQPLGMIVLPAIPNLYSFMISIGLINLEKGEEYKAKTTIESPTGTSIFDNEIVFTLDDPNQPEDVITGGEFNINCRNVELPEEGNYIVKVGIGTEEKTLVLPVFTEKSI